VPNVLVRVLSFVFALSWLTPPGWGAPDLGMTWNADWETILEGSWGLLFTVGVALPFVVIGCVPRRAGAALAQLWLVAIALLVGLALGGRWQGLWMVALLVAEILVLSFGRDRERWRPSTSRRLRRSSRSSRSPRSVPPTACRECGHQLDVPHGAVSRVAGQGRCP
jgi:hypothetical protein